MGNGKSKEGKGGGLLAVSRNSLDEGPPTKSSTSVKPNQRVNIYVDDSTTTTVNKNNNQNSNSPTNITKNNNNSLHQSQLSNDSSSTNNNTSTTATTTTGGSTPPNNNNTTQQQQNPNNNTNTATTISNTDSTTSSSPNATNNCSVLTPSNQPSQQQHHVTFGATLGGGSSIVFGVDVSMAVQRSCKLILKLLLQKKQQDSGTTQAIVVEESISEEKKNEYKHPLASDEEIEAIEKVCANLDTLFIPEVIRQCLRFLNYYSSLLEQGVYRIPGDTQKMKEYREAFDKGQSIDFLAENREIDRKRKEAQENGVTVDIVHHGIKHDAHDVAGLIKLFLRELPGDYHLFTPQTAPEFSISHLKNFATEEEKIESVRSSLFRIPRSNRDTLRALCEHFRLIIKYEKSNKMTTDNLLKCICGTSPYVLSFYFMVQFFDIVFKEEKKEQPKTLTEEEMNSTKNIEWLLRAQNDTSNVLSLGNLSHLTGGNNNLSNEALAGKAMSARESRRKSYYQRQQRNDSNASEETPTTDQSDFASPPTTDNSNSDNLDPITLALLKMKKDKDTPNENTIATNTVDSQEQNDSSITVEM